MQAARPFHISSPLELVQTQEAESVSAGATPPDGVEMRGDDPRLSSFRPIPCRQIAIVARGRSMQGSFGWPLSLAAKEIPSVNERCGGRSSVALPSTVMSLSKNDNRGTSTRLVGCRNKICAARDLLPGVSAHSSACPYCSCYYGTQANCAPHRLCVV